MAYIEGSQTSSNEYTYLKIDIMNPMYYKIPEEGTIIRFTGYYDIDIIQKDPKETKPSENSFMVHNFGTNERPVLKLLQFKNQTDLNDFTEVFNTILLDDQPRNLFMTSGCNSSDPGVFKNTCDFSGGSPSYSDVFGHTKNPITDFGQFGRTAPSSYRMVGKDRHLDKNNNTDIYPEGKFVKCKLGGINNVSDEQTTTPPMFRQSVPLNLYRVDKYGALCPLPYSPQDWAINYSWNDENNDWMDPEIYPDCTGIDFGDTLNFNPAMTTELCSIDQKSCIVNTNAIALMDGLTDFYNSQANNINTDDGKKVFDNISGSIITMVSDIQNILIGGLISFLIEMFKRNSERKKRELFKNNLTNSGHMASRKLVFGKSK
jgi:hypothetical protein